MECIPEYMAKDYEIMSAGRHLRYLANTGGKVGNLLKHPLLKQLLRQQVQKFL